MAQGLAQGMASRLKLLGGPGPARGQEVGCPWVLYIYGKTPRECNEDI